MNYGKLKPFLDRVGAGVLLVVFLPFFAFLIMLLAIAQRGSVFFLQVRAGKNDQPFRIYKFRTMRNGTPHPEDDLQRITPLGTWLRRLHVDEWPQLVNILKGDMSFIGPRPLLTEYTALYDAQSRKRLLVRPGLTGLAQIRADDPDDWKKRLELDVYYVEHLSFKLDVQIAIHTLTQLGKKRKQSFQPYRGANDSV
ncbi:MAG: sugar transferase [Cyclobacteriaceae bacterium]|nr:sugar transferase [Cyclobacteriaceae bacterium]